MNSTSRKALFFILLIGMAYVSYAYMIKPANLHLTKERDKVVQKQAKLKELEKATADAKDLTEQLKKVEEAIHAFESKLPPENAVETVLQDIAVIVQKHSLTSKMIRTLPQKRSKGYIELPLEMELEGNFNSYYAFLLEVEKLDRITKIRELTLKKQSKYEGQTQSRFIISIFFQNSDA